MTRLHAWLADPSHQVGILVVLAIAAIGHLAIGQWTPAGMPKDVLELAFAVFLLLVIFSVSRARGWLALAGWIGASAVMATLLGIALATTAP